jgi:hypothetical protein
LRLLDITALAHFSGNRIDLTWSNPDPAQFPGIRVVRREGAYPTGPQDGVLVLDATGATAAADRGLRAETVYYYALYPYSGSPPQYDDDPHNRVSAMATGQYGFAARMYQLLPSIYRRYDAQQLPPPGSGVAPQDLSRGVLQRYLDLPGGQLDQFFSLARAALELHDVNTLEGVLLPLLAQWIGWRTDYALPVDAQRNEIRFAPQLYRTTGTITALDATVDRITGWPVQTKEYMHNVARTNQPERLNLWAVSRDATGTWGTAALASVNFAYDGRPGHVTDQDGSELFLFHTYRPHGWDIWAKRLVSGQWQPSEPVVDRPGADKYPSVALLGSTLWLFWNSYDAAAGQWRIWYQTRTGGAWTAGQWYGDTTTERRNPAVVADGTGGIWLFWREWAAGRWQVRFNRNDGTNWQLSPDGTMPQDGGQPVDVDDDLIAVINPSPAGTLWLFWSRHDPASAGQTRWSIACRVKKALDPTVADWSVVQVLPKSSPDVHDREPAPLPAANGNLELFWATTRGGGWSIGHAQLDTTALTWSTPDFIAPGPYSQRAPLAIGTGSGSTAGTLLTYRTNQSLAYQSPLAGAEQTLDDRYAGTTTVRTTDAAKLALRGAFEDFQAYTYQGGALTDADRITRGTIGLFVTPGTSDPTAIAAAVSRLQAVLPEFMPVTARAVVITP